MPIELRCILLGIIYGAIGSTITGLYVLGVSGSDDGDRIGMCYGCILFGTIATIVGMLASVIGLRDESFDGTAHGRSWLSTPPYPLRIT